MVIVRFIASIILFGLLFAAAAAGMTYLSFGGTFDPYLDLVLSQANERFNDLGPLQDVLESALEDGAISAEILREEQPGWFRLLAMVSSLPVAALASHIVTFILVALFFRR